MQDNPYGIAARTLSMGADYVILITGGQAHIGASATAYIGDEGVQVMTSALPHHREDRLAAEWAAKAAERLGAAVTVVAGIHIDNATKDDIRRILHDVDEVMETELARLSRTVANDNDLS